MHGAGPIVFCSTLMLSLAACMPPATSDTPNGSGSSTAGGKAPALLEGPEWTVSTLDGEPVPQPAKVTIQFLEGERVAGNSGCNRFQGSYSGSRDSLSFGPLMGTRMACPQPQMAVESRFFGLMQQVAGFEITADGTLVLETDDGKRILAER